MRTTTKIVVLLAATLALAACSSTDEGASGQADGDAGWTRIGAQELSEMMAAEDVYLVNVHVPYEGEIPGTDAHISYTDIASQLGQLPTSGDPTLVIYCRSGNMSTEAAGEMVNAGSPHFYELGGGWYTWQDAGLPFEVN
jgi:rhodanese-related sulfurtransferase